jgi:DNA-binding GntR family transcriptional regulator
MSDVIKYKPLTQSVFERLLSDILHGKLRPGDPLCQEEITARFGVSRTPVREAIQRLQAEGLVTSVPRRTPAVAAIPVRKVRELYEIRARLEAFATELAVGRLSEHYLLSGRQ